VKWHFIRHGEIHSNLRKIYAGWSDEPLTEKGVVQAEEAGEQLAGMEIDAIYHSPLKRTAQTAQIIGRHLESALIPDDRFIEFRLGPWEGLGETQIARSYPEKWALWNTFPADLRLPGRETLHELQERVLQGMAAIERDRDNEGSVLIVSHVAIIRVVQLYAENRDLNDYKQIAVENGRLFSFDAIRLDSL